MDRSFISLASSSSQCYINRNNAVERYVSTVFRELPARTPKSIYALQ